MNHTDIAPRVHSEDLPARHGRRASRAQAAGLAILAMVGSGCGSAAPASPSRPVASGWGQPQQLNPPAPGTVVIVGEAKLIVDAAGNAIAAWSESQAYGRAAMRLSRYRVGQGWGAPEMVGGGVLYGIELVGDAAGDALVVWARSEGNQDVLVFTRSNVGAPFTPSVPIPGAARGRPRTHHLVMDASGRALLVTQNQTPTGSSDMYAQTFTIGEGWSAAQPILSVVGPDAEEPTVAVNAAGEGVLLWAGRSEDGTPSIRASRFVAGAGWRLPQDVSVMPDPFFGFLTPVIDGEGSVRFVWQEIRNWYGPIATWSQHVLSRRWRGNGSWDSVEDVATSFFPEKMTAGPDGHVLVLMESLPGRQQLAGQWFLPGSGWRRPEALSSGAVKDFDGSVGPGGLAEAVWSVDGPHQVWARRYEPGTGWAATATPIDHEVTSPPPCPTGSQRGVSSPTVRTDGYGNALALWTEGDCGGGTPTVTVWANRFTVAR